MESTLRPGGSGRVPGPRVSRMRRLALASVLVASCGSSDPAGSAAPPAGARAPLALSAAWTYGDALCGAASTDGALYVAAEGASIAVLDGTSLAAGDAQPRVVARAPTVAAPYALACDPPYVFVAGGTAGLWCVTIADGDVVGTVDGAWRDEVRIAGAAGAACLDVTSLAGHPSGPLVVAVTCARPGFGTSELVVADRDAPHALRARIALVPDPAAPGAKAFAVAADPADPRAVYVAMGTAGIWRVDLTDLSRPVVVPGPVFDRPDDRLAGEPAAARDVACVRAGERSLLFAAIERGGLAQIDVTDAARFGPALETTRAALACGSGCGPAGVPYGFRVSAVGRADGRVFVALATNGTPAERLESGPFSALGRWEFDLELALADVAPAGCNPRTFLLRGEPEARTVSVVGAECRKSSARSVDVVPRAGGLVVFEQRFDGARGSALPASAWTSANVHLPAEAAPYAGAGLAGVDGTSSSVDPGFLYFGADGISLRPSGVSRFDTARDVVEIVSGTSALCPSGATQFCNTAETAILPPNPWTNGITGGACWTAAIDPGREWFAAGKSRVSSQCAADPCAWTDAWCADPWREEGDAPSDDDRPPGWEVVRLDTAASAAGGAALDVKFWSIASPADAFGRRGRNYFGSATSTDASGSARLLHLFRGVVREGYLVCSADEVVQLALGTCGDARGRGQRVQPSWMHALTTHYELEPGDDPANALTWRGETFALDVGGARRSYLAIATGWVVPTARARWSEHANRASLLVYDVTGVDAQHAPRLARILLGPRTTPGDAVAVRGATLGGRTWLFAGDLAGAVHAFDVSAANLVDALPDDPTDPATALEPSASWYGPLDAYDGKSSNVTDLELDLDTDPARPVLVLANARRGLAVIEVDVAEGSIALREAERSPIDTPGVASGLVPIRKDGATWFAVGDARCGVRVYRR